jgi:hypothetical protein
MFSLINELTIPIVRRDEAACDSCADHNESDKALRFAESFAAKSQKRNFARIEERGSDGVTYSNSTTAM